MFVGITRQVLVSAVRTGRVAGRHNFSTGRSMRGGHGHEKEQGWAYRYCWGIKDRTMDDRLL